MAAVVGDGLLTLEAALEIVVELEVVVEFGVVAGTAEEKEEVVAVVAVVVLNSGSGVSEVDGVTRFLCALQ